MELVTTLVIVAILAGLAIPTLFGFTGKGEVSAQAVLGLKLAFVAWPCLLLVPMVVAAWRYPLDRRAQGLLARRLAGRPRAERG